ncbi:relaxase/mobilization nuclease domain-containing protein [Delftia sp. HK171]|uniref:relaxase/mobilization nuclease domain-containing protein n=1 Tax=Delftia sp. HK171 TaxID=1920191 RepID=UPI001C8A7436|nr:relaxase/mobilization nuclease domain-containing protein [Delftia sp. HK171]
MIAKIVKGKGFRGALNYLFRDGRAMIIGGNLSGRTPRELAAEFGQFRKLRPGLAKAVVHIPLSAHPDDRPLSDAEMADRMTQGLGYAESPCVFVRHNDTDHQHMHLLLCRIDRHGNRLNLYAPVSEARSTRARSCEPSWPQHCWEPSLGCLWRQA